MNIINKMVLGTAQLGMNYGITNLAGMPSKEDVLSILDLAWDNGVKRFDTAPSYGMSELLIGEFVRANGIINEAIIMTKIPPLYNNPNYQKTIMADLEKSLNLLGCAIDVLFFHDPNDSNLILKDPQFFEDIIHNYSVSKIGVSIYEPEEVKYLSTCEFPLAFQFPYNILDRRFEEVCIPRGYRYARSVFLQGVLASGNKLIESAPEPLRKIQKNYHSILRKDEIEPIHLALSFVLFSKNIDYFLIGVESLKQLEEILNLDFNKYNKWKNFNSIELKFDSRWLDPREWN